MHARPVVGGVVTIHRSRPDHKQTLHTKRSTTTMAKARAKIFADIYNPASLIAVVKLTLENIALYVAMAVCTPPTRNWLFDWKWNAHHGSSGPWCHRVLRHSTVPVYTHGKVGWNQLWNVCRFRGAGTPPRERERAANRYKKVSRLMRKLDCRQKLQPADARLCLFLSSDSSWSLWLLLGLQRGK